MVIAAALCAALAGWLAIPAGSRPLRRLTTTQATSFFAKRPPDALATKWRLLLGLAMGAAASFLLPERIWWLAVPLAVVAFFAAGLLRSPQPAVQSSVAQLPDAIELISVCLSAGSPLPVAVEHVAAVSAEPTKGFLSEVAAQLRIGRNGDVVWRELADDPTWGPVARDLARSVAAGTAVVETLQIHAVEARKRATEQRLKAARSVGVKSVLPLMACFLPAFVLVSVVPILASLFDQMFG